MERILRSLVVILFAAVLVVGQDKILSRAPNFPKIARAWNSIVSETKSWNHSMQSAEALLKERFNPKILVADPDAKRRECVGHYKVARESLLKELDALNELMEEEDY